MSKIKKDSIEVIQQQGQEISNLNEKQKLTTNEKQELLLDTAHEFYIYNALIFPKTEENESLLNSITGIDKDYIYDYPQINGVFQFNKCIGIRLKNDYDWPELVKLLPQTFDFIIRPYKSRSLL